MGSSASSSRGLLSTNLPLFACLLQLPVSLSMDLLLTAGEHVLRRDVANGVVGQFRALRYRRMAQGLGTSRRRSARDAATSGRSRVIEPSGARHINLRLTPFKRLRLLVYPSGILA